jgi:guanylate kinase
LHNFRRTLKSRILQCDPDQFSSPLPHTSRSKRAEEDNGMRYWFVDREDMEFGIKQHEFLEYGEFGENLYGTRFDSIQAIIDSGKTAVIDPTVQSLKLLRSSPGENRECEFG